MRICFLSHITNYHTKKWCDYFLKRGHEVHVISFENGKIEGVQSHIINLNVNRKSGDFQKIKYIFAAKHIKRIVQEIEPDIINVHFATSYGIATAFSGVKNYFISVWGYDIYEFPKKSVFHKMLLKFSLKRAKYILSTSKAMAKETNKYTKKSVEITPFGINTEIFKPTKNKKSQEKIVIGTIKSLEKVYGIEYLIRALKILNDGGVTNIELRIAGEGTEKKHLMSLAKEKNIDAKISWLGFISEKEVVNQLNEFDIAIIPSLSESFGVSALEAQACEVPVIVTNVGGLSEATKPKISSIVIKPKSEQEIAKAIKYLINDKAKRREMGQKGREYVKENFELYKNFEDIEKIFFKAIQGKR